MSRGDSSEQILTTVPESAALRWLLISAFLVSSALNYLDRLLLASLAPALKTEFHLNDLGYGNLVAAFAITYAVCSPVLGWLMDRFGLSPITTVAVGIWSAAGIATGFVYSYASLFWCRLVLGVGEAGGIPATGKAYGTYLLPKERALGAGVGQIGISAGSLIAPLLAAWALRRGHWQWAFVVAGACGFVWIAVWLLIDRTFPVRPTPSAWAINPRDLLRDSRFLRLVAANFLTMAGYTLWTNWTTLYLVRTFSLHAEYANRAFAWIPPLGGTAGALIGGYWSMRRIASGSEVVSARIRVFLIMSVLATETALVPLCPTPGLATAGVALSYLFIAAGSTNLYTIPVDLYGSQRAALAVSGLVASYGATTAVFNPLFGAIITRYGTYAPVCAAVAVLPLAAYFCIRGITPLNGSQRTSSSI
jgi:MFS transporter, ACS family, hexuronate transporter